MEIGLLLAYTATSLLVILSPGPDNLLVVSRALSQGRTAALTASLGSGAAVMFHTLAAALGISLLIQASPAAFLGVKIVGGAYLAWLGIRAITARNLVTFRRSASLPLHRVFAVSTMTGVLNPKSGLFLLAFLPQFAHFGKDMPISLQMFLLGCLYAVLSILVFGCIGTFAARLSRWLEQRPKSTLVLNVGAGTVFLAVAVSVLLL